MMNNTSSTASLPLWVSYATELRVWFTTMIFLSVFGTLFNLLLVVVVLSSRKLRTGSGVLIAYVHIVLTLQCSVNMPLLFAPVYQALLTNRTATDAYCRDTFPFQWAMSQVVSWSDMMIAINRMVAICFPYSYPKWTEKKALIIMMIIPWCSGVTTIGCLRLGIGGVFRSVPPWGACGAIMYPVMAQLNAIFSTAIPVGGSGVIYIVIFVVMAGRWLSLSRKSGNRLAPLQVSPAARQERKTVARRNKSAKILFVVYIWYGTCLSPTPIAASLYPVVYNSLPILQLLFRALLLLGYATMPVCILRQFCTNLKTDYFTSFIGHLFCNEHGISTPVINPDEKTILSFFTSCRGRATWIQPRQPWCRWNDR